MSLRRYTWRAMQQRPGRTILTMLSIVIGVTAAVAVGLGTATTRNAYKQMFALVTGRATLEVDAAGGGGFSGEVFERVAAVEGVVAATPLVDRVTSMSYADGEKRARLQVLGVDPKLDRTVRDYDIIAGRMVAEGDELILEQGFAEHLGLKVDDEVRLLVRSRRFPPSQAFTIVGLFQPRGGVAFTQTALALVPVDRAQQHLNPPEQPDLLDRIQIITPEGVDPAAIEARVAAVLPEGVQVHRPAAQTQLMRDTLLSSEQGLRLMTLFSLLMAAFIILNTFLMNVSERRRHLSIMRAIGATRRQIAWSLLGEALVLGVIGIAIGMGLGVGVAWVVTYVLASAFNVQLPRLVEVMTAGPFILGAVFGLAMTLLGAVVPAALAARVSPLEGMNRLVRRQSPRMTWLFLIGGAVLTAGSMTVIGLSIVGRLPAEVAPFCGWPLMIGLVMLDSVILAPQAAAVAAFLKPFFRVESTLALKQVLRHHTRSALTVGVLFIAGSTGVGMANSILDNVNDVHEWHDKAIVGDYFLRAMMPDMATGTAADLPPGIDEELTTLYERGQIKWFDGAAFVEAQVPQGDDSAEALQAIVVCRTFPEGSPSFDAISGDASQFGRALRDGKVIVSSVLAQKLGVELGDSLPLETQQGVQQIPIAGIVNDYMVGGMGIHMHRDYAERWLGVTGVDGYMIKAAEGRLAGLEKPLAAIADKYEILLMSQADILLMIERIIDGAEWSLWALLCLGFVVAAFGVVNTLAMNVLEQTRELGLLRIVAMTKKQVRRTVLMQALIIGGIGLPPGVLVGVAIAYVLNLAMMPSFGHPIDFHIYWEMLAFTLVGALAIVLIAAIIPARRAAQIDVVEALHYE